MTTEICTACNGEGIIGAGDFPLAKQGKLTTCTVCTGTGKCETVIAEPEPIEDIVVLEPEVQLTEESFLGELGTTGDVVSEISNESHEDTISE